MLASMGKLKEWAMEALLNYVARVFTFENFKAAMKVIAEKWQAKAQETDTFIDNWAVDFLFTVINNDEKLQRFYDWINGYIVPAQEGAVKALPFNKNIAELAVSLTESDEQLLKAVNINAIVELLQLLVPLLIELFNKSEK